MKYYRDWKISSRILRCSHYGMQESAGNADWVIGINLTSVATLKYQQGKSKALNIGRVLLPTLKIIYDRDQEIKNFKPEDYFKLTATFQTADNQEYEGIYTEKKEDKFKKKRIIGADSRGHSKQTGYHYR